MAGVRGRGIARIASIPAFRVLRYPDFRWLWLGAFFSFTGTQIQNVAQGFYVYQLTGDKTKLALVAFFLFIPMTFIAPFAGTIADIFHKRTIIVVAMVVNGLAALYVAIAYTFGFLEYWHLLAVALLTGVMQTVEAPTRQSIVRLVVPAQDFASAIPAQALTFNLARVAGPAIGGVLADRYGPGACFFVNSASFLGLIFAAFAIRTDLSPAHREPQPMWDLVTEGIRYTFRHRALKTLFIMEAATSLCAFHISQMPAIAKSMLGLGAQGLGWCYTAVGVGAICGLLTLGAVSHLPYKPFLVRLSMATVAISLLAFAFVRHVWIALPLLGLIGFGTIMQFNTTNTLFQLMSLPHLRGRVISMHLWALAGLAPPGILFFGWLAEEISLPSAFLAAGGIMVFAATWAYWRRADVYEPDHGESELAPKGDTPSK